MRESYEPIIGGTEMRESYAPIIGIAIGLIFIGLVVAAIMFTGGDRNKNTRNTFLECIERTDDTTWCYDKIN